MSGQRRAVPPGAGLPATRSIVTPGLRCHAARKVGDADFFRGADVINAEMLAFFTHHHDAGDKVVDEAEAARFLPAALDFEPDRSGRLLL